MVSSMDPFYVALNQIRRHKFEQCAQTCTSILQQEKQNQAAWVLKLRALTHLVAFDDTEVMESLADSSPVNDNKITCTARPGTSLSTITRTAQRDLPTEKRPLTQSRPISGVVRLSRNGMTGSRETSDQNLATARIHTSRILSRLGTASLHGDSQSFINVTRLNLGQYATLPQLAKPLFEYLYFVKGDFKNALDLANQVQQRCAHNRKDIQGNSYWKCAVARCLVRLGLVRQVIQGTSDWYFDMSSVDGILIMAKSFIIMDQPLAALELFQRGLDQKFPNDISLLLGIARIHEELNLCDQSVATYKRVLNCDPGNIEGVACMASHLFYNGQPEWALVLYRRLLQLGVHTAEIFCNIALCCLKTNQFDLVIPCVENALSLADGLLLADVWYNMGHVALSTGSLDLAAVCWMLALKINANHFEACNNLGVLALMNGDFERGLAFLKAALSFENDLAEAQGNMKLIKSNKYGNEHLI